MVPSVTARGIVNMTALAVAQADRLSGGLIPCRTDAAGCRPAHQQGRPTEAENLYLRALMEQPDLFEARLLSGRPQECSRTGLPMPPPCWEGALRLRPDDVTALVNYGLTLHTLGRATEALSSFDRALAVQPDSADIQYRRGATLAELGRSMKHWRPWTRRWRCRADFAEAVFFRGIVLGDLGRNDASQSRL